MLAAGVDPTRIYEDLASGRRDDRPGLVACLKAIQPGNTLVLWKLDRLGRDLRHLRYCVAPATKRLARITSGLIKHQDRITIRKAASRVKKQNCNLAAYRAATYNPGRVESAACQSTLKIAPSSSSSGQNSRLAWRFPGHSFRSLELERRVRDANCNCFGCGLGACRHD